MRLSHILQADTFIDPQLQVTANNHLQDFVGTLLEFFAAGDVVL